MFGVLLTIVCFVVTYFVAATDRSSERSRVIRTIVIGYVLRLALQTFVRYLPVFSHGLAAGDNVVYEWKATLLSTVWRHTGWHYVGADELDLGQTTLPANLFGTIIYINGGPTRLGCTAVVALAACLTCYNMYRLALELGADERTAYRTLLFTFFAPGFLMYTSDMYKDGFVLLLATGAVASSFRLARRLSLMHACLGALCLVGLWQVRFYLVFVTTAPLLVGMFGLTSRSLWRPLVAAVAIVAVGMCVAAFTPIFSVAAEKMSSTFGQVDLTREANAVGGSAVTFDDNGEAFGAFVPKLFYTLLSPFPWTSGSIGLQVGKLDVLIWYVFLYRALANGRRLLRERPGLLLMFAVFLVPTTVMYATSMANMGLILRQRLPIVFVTALLATILQREKARSATRSDQAIGSVPARSPLARRLRATH